jgi:hypothetical protein
MQLIKSLLFLCLFSSSAFGAVGNHYWVGTTNNNFSNANNWALTSGGTGGTATVPSTTDTAIFDGNGLVDLTVDATETIYRLSVTSGYTNKFTFTNNIQLTVCTLGANMTFTASATKGILGSGGTFTSNGVTFTALLSLANGTTTLGDNWTVTGGVAATGGTATVNSNTLNIGGNLTATGAITGTTTLNINGTGTWTGTGVVATNLTINTSGTLTLASGVTIAYKTGTLTYTAGTIVNTGNTLALNGACTFNTNGMSWNNVSVGGGITVTINSLLSISSQLLLTANNTATFAGTTGWTCGTFQWENVNAQSTTLHSGNTYTVTAQIILTGAVGGGAEKIIASTVSGTKAILNYTGPNTGQAVFYASFQDIDASGGNTIWDKLLPGAGTLTRTVNINTYTNTVPIGYGDVR